MSSSTGEVLPDACAHCRVTPGWRELCAWVLQPDDTITTRSVVAACDCEMGQWRTQRAQAQVYTAVITAAQMRYGARLIEVFVSDRAGPLSASQRNPPRPPPAADAPAPNPEGVLRFTTAQRGAA